MNQTETPQELVLRAARDGALCLGDSENSDLVDTFYIYGKPASRRGLYTAAIRKLTRDGILAPTVINGRIAKGPVTIR
jgi:hypothetical protein